MCNLNFKWFSITFATIVWLVILLFFEMDDFYILICANMLLVYNFISMFGFVQICYYLYNIVCTFGFVEICDQITWAPKFNLVLFS
jgi:hypothetical protein